MALVNRAYADKQGLGVYLRYRVAELPYLVQWKMMGLGHYICGLEPSTNLVEDRAKERQEGRLQFLEPGEARSYEVEIGVLASPSEIERFAATLERQLAYAPCHAERFRRWKQMIATDSRIKANSIHSLQELTQWN